MKTSTPLERRLMLLCLGFIGCILGLIICFAAEHQSKIEYKQRTEALLDSIESAHGWLDTVGESDVYQNWLEVQ